MKKSLGCRALIVVVVLFTRTAQAGDIRIDCANRQGAFRPLHGVNGGPLNQGETVNLTKYWRDAAIPLTRLHDCEWPGGRVVDFKTVFPILSADPTKAESYTFAETDEYVRGVVEAGSAIVYRLGENIEHTKVKHRVNPPADPDRWAAACLGIIRHYNEGWANGFHHKIRYWEIWNEPENRPAMWTGSDAEYYRLYAAAARAIKSEFPNLKVGGPAVGSLGKVEGGVLQPSAFLAGFLRECKDKSLPLDFFSWHGYTDDPSAYLRKAAAVRRWLDEHGFAKTEIHLNEWNYLPGNDWGPMLAGGQGKKRQAMYDAIGGPHGAAFVATVLLHLQDSPVDAANLFSGDSGPFGLFTQHGEPKKTFDAVKAFRRLLDTPLRVRASGVDPAHGAVAAGMSLDQREIVVLLTSYRGPDDRFTIAIENRPWKGASKVRIHRLDAAHGIEASAAQRVENADRLSIALPAPALALISIRPVEDR